MISGSLARRYARAVLSIGIDAGNYEALGSEVASVARAMAGSQELADALTNPIFPRSQRAKLLGKLLIRLGVSKTVRNFFSLLLDRERIGHTPDIARALSAMIDERAGRQKAIVTSAQPLSPAQAQQLQQTLEAVSGKTIEMEKNQDPELLAGVVAQVGDVVYDGSLRTQLERMRASLTSNPS